MQRKLIQISHASAAGEGGPWGALIVEGGIFFSGFLADFLAREGAQVAHASSAQEAIATARQMQPELILVDAELKGFSGLDLLPELFMELPWATVIVLSSRPNFSEAAQAIRLGAADYMARPLNFEKLGALIRAQRRLSTTI